MQSEANPKGEKVLGSDGASEGHTTGGSYACRMEGCRGTRLAVRWRDGTLSYPCTHGMNMVDKTTWKIIA